MLQNFPIKSEIVNNAQLRCRKSRSDYEKVAEIYQKIGILNTDSSPVSTDF